MINFYRLFIDHLHSSHRSQNDAIKGTLCHVDKSISYLNTASRPPCKYTLIPIIKPDIDARDRYKDEVKTVLKDEPKNENLNVVNLIGMKDDE